MKPKRNNIKELLDNLPVTLESGWVIESINMANQIQKTKYPQVNCICPCCKKKKVLRFDSVFYSKSKYCVSCRNNHIAESQKTDDKLIPLNIRIKNLDFQRLRYIAIKKNKTVSDIVREAISIYLEEE